MIWPIGQPSRRTAINGLTGRPSCGWSYGPGTPVSGITRLRLAAPGLPARRAGRPRGVRRPRPQSGLRLPAADARRGSGSLPCRPIRRPAGGLWSPTELGIDPRQALDAIPAYLRKAPWRLPAIRFGGDSHRSRPWHPGPHGRRPDLGCGAHAGRPAGLRRRHRPGPAGAGAGRPQGDASCSSSSSRPSWPAASPATPTCSRAGRPRSPCCSPTSAPSAAQREARRRRDRALDQRRDGRAVHVRAGRGAACWSITSATS